MRARVLLAAAAAALALACGNAGEDLILSLGATGVVRGFVFFDVNGNRALDPSADDSVRNIRIRLVAKNSSDTIASTLSNISGFYQMTAVPVGTYLVQVDTTPLLDTAIVALQEQTEITIGPDDTLGVNVGISYPHLTIAQARALAPGRRVFVEGIVLNAPANFSDTTMHVQDAGAAIRNMRVLATGAGAADSVRLRGTTARRQISPTVQQPVLDNVTTFVLAPRFLPQATTLTTGQARTASGGTRDAQQLRVLNATISDTATVPGGFRLTLNDASGPLMVVLDVTDPRYRQAPLLAQLIPTNRFDVVGIAIPTDTAGVWLLKPRSAQELVFRP